MPHARAEEQEIRLPVWQPAGGNGHLGERITERVPGADQAPAEAQAMDPWPTFGIPQAGTVATTA